MKDTPYPNTPWTVLQKTVFLFFAIFFALVIIPNPFTLLPGDYWFKLIQWTGKYLLHIPYEITVRPNGSGDTTYNYVELLLNLTIALLTVVIWLLIDLRRESYRQLYDWSLVLVRYYLYFTMLQYGFFKVIQLQFPFPSQGELLQPLGDSSPMGLAWNFMGYSKGYNFFAGFLEILGGLLLCFRRTATLGALIVFGVMSNVVAMNFCFDIPVKIYSMELLGMSVYVMWPDRQRLIDFLIRNKAVEPRIINRLFSKKGLHIARIALKSLLVAGLMIYMFIEAWGYQKSFGEYAPKPSLYGMYEVETFVRNGDTLPPLRSDTSRWHKMVISFKDRASVRMVNDSVRNFDFKINPKLKTIQMSPKGDTLQKFRLTYQQPAKDQLVIKGRSKNDSLYIKFHTIDRNRYLLVNRGFHWINEFPLNR